MILGKGINDIKGDSSLKSEHYKIYGLWHAMLNRCYSTSFHKRNPSYIGTIVCDEWLLYSNFKKWCLDNYIEGYELDKDIIGGNKRIYSPDTCAFIPRAINGTLIEPQNKKQNNPLGVYKHKKSNGMINERKKPYEAAIKTHKMKKAKCLGMFVTAEEAHKAWQIAKRDYFIELIEQFKNDVIPEVIQGLQRRIDILQYDIDNNLITATINKV